MGQGGDCSNWGKEALHKHLELSSLLVYFSKWSVQFYLPYVFSCLQCLLAKIYEVCIT